MPKRVELTYDVTLEELKKSYNTENHANRKNRILIIMHALSGYSARKIAKILFTTKNTVIFWIRKFNQYGFDGLNDDPRPGRPRKVDYEHIKKVIANSPQLYGYEQQVWHPKLLKQYLQEQLKLQISENYEYHLINALNYSLIVPSKKSYKSDHQKVQAFKKK